MNKTQIRTILKDLDHVRTGGSAQELHAAEYLERACRSLGADTRDLARLLKAAGASDAINVDGGGSSTLVRYDQSGGGVVIDNRHDPDRYHYRNVAVSLGFYLP